MGITPSSPSLDTTRGDIAIAVVGKRAVGKSTFINTATKSDALPVGHAPDYDTSDVQLVEYPDPNRETRKIVFAEVPPFEGEVHQGNYHKKLKRWLGTVSSKNIKISGILYLHPITDAKTPEITSWLADLSKHISQGRPVPVVLATTMWGRLFSRAVGGEREKEYLRCWNELGAGVSRIMQFNDTHEGAWSVVFALVEHIEPRPVTVEVLDEKASIRSPPLPLRVPAPPPLRRPSVSAQPYSEKPPISPVDAQASKGNGRRPPVPPPTRKSSYRTRLASFSYSYVQARVLISAIIKDDDQTARVARLKGKDAQTIVDFLNTVLHDKGALDTDEGKGILNLLSKLAKSAEVFPRCYELDGIVDPDLNKPQGGGGFADIYKGKCGNQDICLKAVRLYSSEYDKLLKACVKELVLWAHLSHENILPFYGVYLLGRRICLISPWMNKGDLSHHLQDSPETPRLPLASDIASGLLYLHQSEIVHGDLKAYNVLVSDDGRALLADFGISQLAMSSGHSSVTSTGTMRWKAPELHRHENISPTPESDIWSVSCLFYELFTRKIPFYQYQNDLKVLRAVDTEEIPIRPKDVDPLDTIEDCMWDLMKRCWDYDPEKRPSCQYIQRFIAELRAPDDRPPPSMQISGSSQAFWKSVKARSETMINDTRIYQILHQAVSNDIITQATKTG